MSKIGGIFSASNTASWSRTGSFIALICSCAWVSWIVYKHIQLPDLGGITIFVTSLYALGKTGETIQHLAAKPAVIETTKTETAPDGTAVVQATKTVDAVKPL